MGSAPHHVSAAASTVQAIPSLTQTVRTTSVSCDNQPNLTAGECPLATPKASRVYLSQEVDCSVILH